MLQERRVPKHQKRLSAFAKRVSRQACSRAGELDPDTRLYCASHGKGASCESNPHSGLSSVDNAVGAASLGRSVAIATSAHGSTECVARPASRTFSHQPRDTTAENIAEFFKAPWARGEMSMGRKSGPAIVADLASAGPALALQHRAETFATPHTPPGEGLQTCEDGPELLRRAPCTPLASCRASLPTTPQKRWPLSPGGFCRLAEDDDLPSCADTLTRFRPCNLSLGGFCREDSGCGDRAQEVQGGGSANCPSREWQHQDECGRLCREITASAEHRCDHTAVAPTPAGKRARRHMSGPQGSASPLAVVDLTVCTPPRRHRRTSGGAPSGDDAGTESEDDLPLALLMEKQKVHVK